MQTLLIDNYDSFTHNLAHYLAEVTGVSPMVVRNDEPGWTPADLDAFHNVVISPGPGHPRRVPDFGICAEVIRDARIPLLGVCLGHQGICTVHGGHVGAASEVFHGRESAVVHSGIDILEGVPSPFAAVRYHSLAVTALPEDLEPIAWTQDGPGGSGRRCRRGSWIRVTGFLLGRVGAGWDSARLVASLHEPPQHGGEDQLHRQVHLSARADDGVRARHE
ncbi:MAG: hypothetical protein GEU86_08375 [Actinophytocola sp.]|nr:hypothetical protein [Actinophytocola sp.]